QCTQDMPEKYGRQFWTMCLLGTGTAEYFKYGFDVFDTYARINGQKNENRIRKVPLVQTELYPAACNPVTLRLELAKVRPTWQLYDARRSFQHWCEMAGIPVIRIKMYAGHVARGISEIYRRHEVEQYLQSDAD